MEFRQRIRNLEGSSLVEVLMVIAAISILIILIASFPNSMNLVSKSQHQSLAREIAAKQIEDLRNLSYVNLVLGETQILDSRVSLLPSGNGKIIVENCDPDICVNDENTKTVTVTVLWKEATKDQKIEINTLISEGGLSK